MLGIDIVSCVPKLLESPFSHSILKRAQEKGLAEVRVRDLRDYSTSKYKAVDDYAYGGGAGMILMMDPLVRCLKELSKEHDYDEVIYTSPDGELFTQKMANELSLKKNLFILCGHYKGVDERFREKYVTREISVGDYVLSGGELAAAVICDAVMRLVPGVLSDETSALSDSYQDDMIAPPVYTRPADFEGMKVPDILLSGNEAAIEQWRLEQSLARTKERRPDLYKKFK